MEGKIQTFLDVNLLKGDRKQLWVNPDCGLKTREWSQVCQPCLDVETLWDASRACFAGLRWLLAWQGCRRAAAALRCASHLCSGA